MGKVTSSALGVLLLGATCAGASAQSFDDGSFEQPPGGTPPAVTEGGTTPAVTGAPSGGSFDEGSFTEGGAAVSTTLVPPPPPPPNDGGGPIVAPPGGSGGGVVPPPPPPPDNNSVGVVPPPPPPPDNNGGTTPAFPDSDQAVVPPDTRDGTAHPPRQGPPVDPRITAFETRDFGVPPQSELRQGPMHAQTPTSIPGAQLVTTANLAQALNSGNRILVIDVLGSGYGLPGALPAQPMSNPGSFQDQTQQQVVAWLNQVTGGNRNMAIVIYCSDPMCWLSYNATLRAVAAGYGNVYWYRGGIRAWEMAGLPLRPMGF